MKYREFAEYRDLADEVVKLLEGHFALKMNVPHAVMLAGGGTPLGVYERIAKISLPVDDGLKVILSDERYVPDDSANSNFGRIKPMLHSLGMDDGRLIRVDTSVALERAAAGFDARLKDFLDVGGVVTLGLMGLGADGHTTSLFTDADLERGAGRYAVAVRRGDGMDGISVTPDFLSRVRRLVFIVSGEGKREIVRRFLDEPQSLIAGKAAKNVSDIELWYSLGESVPE